LNCYSVGGRIVALHYSIAVFNYYGYRCNLEGRIKKLSSQAIQCKLDLHDLSEELPTGWERILEVAEKTYLTYQKLAEARRKLAALGG